MMTCGCSRLCSQAYHLVADWLHDPAAVQALTIIERMYDEGRVLPGRLHKLLKLHVELYRQYRAGGGDVIFSHRLDNGDGADLFIKDGMEWADYTGLGLARITVDFQREHAPAWDQGPWFTLDGRFSEWTYRLGSKWHVHWPVAKHNHLGEG
jgi:hypothetical protein